MADGSILKWVIVLGLVFIGVYAFYATGNIVQTTQPANNSSFLANQSAQTNNMINLTGALLPGVLVLVSGVIILKALKVL
jgi:hypothetical protein